MRNPQVLLILGMNQQYLRDCEKDFQKKLFPQSPLNFMNDLGVL